MHYWRNTDRSTFDAGGVPQERLDQVLAELARDTSSVLPDAVDAVLESLPWAAVEGLSHFEARDGWRVQEILHRGNVFRAGFVLGGVERDVLGHVVGGGIEFCVRADDGIRGEFALYYYRLVCTNGMTEPLARTGRLAAWTLDEWTRTVEAHMPRVVGRLRRGFARMRRAGEVRFDDPVAVLPRLLGDLGLRPEAADPVLEAFHDEPGDTAWHLVNAVSAAANVVERRSARPSFAVLRERRELQRAAMKLCRLTTRGPSRVREFVLA
jgi:hypothetical protein